MIQRVAHYLATCDVCKEKGVIFWITANEPALALTEAGWKIEESVRHKDELILTCPDCQKQQMEDYHP